MSDLVKGMMVLDPKGTTGDRPELWVVTAPRTLLRYSDEGITASATLTKSGLPDGWTLIDTDLLASELALDGPLLRAVAADG